jgi:zinc finger protein
MVKREFELPIERCPMCGSFETCTFKGIIHEIPYFGETMESLIWCTECKFKHADVMHLGEREPSRYEYGISSPRDMMVRVVRSSTGFIRVPELGVSIRPGPRSEGFVSNIEGVLNRIEAAIETAMKKASPHQREVGERKLKKLEDIRSGKQKASLVLIDPLGHSAIIHPKAKRRRLRKDELSKLP